MNMDIDFESYIHGSEPNKKEKTVWVYNPDSLLLYDTDSILSIPY